MTLDWTRYIIGTAVVVGLLYAVFHWSDAQAEGARDGPVCESSYSGLINDVGALVQSTGVALNLVRINGISKDAFIETVKAAGITPSLEIENAIDMAAVYADDPEMDTVILFFLSEDDCIITRQKITKDFFFSSMKEANAR